MFYRLAAVFTQAQGEIKRSIIKLLPQSIQNMSINSPEIFRLLEDLPKGAEAMIVRVLHIVTEKGKFLFLNILTKMKNKYHKKMLRNNFKNFTK